MRWFLTFLFALSFVSLPVSAANIHGNIYDFSLNKIGNVIVEIDTIPKQFYVSKNGTYSFAVPIGFYEVKAQHYDRGLLISSTSENMTVKDGGDYILDLVLFPIIDEEELLEDEIKISKGNFYSGYFIFPVVILIILAVFLYFYNKKKIVKKEAERARCALRDFYDSKERLKQMSFDEKRGFLHQLFDGNDEYGVRYGVYVKIVGYRTY